MKIQLTHNDHSYNCNLAQPIDISIPLGQVKCFFATDFKTSPYIAGDFIGSVKAGATVNFFDVQLNPHGNGTHTECLGHITKKQESLNDLLNQYHFIAQLISVPLVENEAGDAMVTLKNLQTACPENLPEALIIRTLPNQVAKLTKDYSGTNPPYLEKAAMEFIVQNKIKHLLVDIPSVDKEADEGEIIGHRLFWNVEDAADKDGSRSDCTITELVYVKDEIEDGLYLLNIQIPSLQLDAAPSKPVLYQLNM